MKLLIIASAYSPDKYASALCASNIVNAFLAQGCEQLDVLTIAHSELNEDVGKYPVCVFRLKNKIVLRESNSMREPCHNKKFFSRAFGKITSIFIWPSLRILALHQLIDKSCELAKKTKYDAMITISGDFVSQMVGIAMKKTHLINKWFPILLDPVPSMHPWHNRWMKFVWQTNKKETYLFNQATICFFEEHILPNFHCQNSNKIIPIGIPNLCNYDGLASNLQKRNNTYCSIVFAGVWKNNIRNPDKALDVLDFVSKSLNIHLTVYTDQEFLSTELITFKSYLSHDELVLEMLKADLLLNIGSKENLFPSKLVDYASTGKPILNVVVSDNDVSKEFMLRYNNGLTICTESSNISNAKAIIEFIKELPPRLTYSEISSRLYMYSPSWITNKISKSTGFNNKKQVTLSQGKRYKK